MTLPALGKLLERRHHQFARPRLTISRTVVPTLALRLALNLDQLANVGEYRRNRRLGQNGQVRAGLSLVVKSSGGLGKQPETLGLAEAAEGTDTRRTGLFVVLGGFDVSPER
jgi:hypothetical protein